MPIRQTNQKITPKLLKSGPETLGDSGPATVFLEGFVFEPPETPETWKPVLQAVIVFAIRFRCRDGEAQPQMAE